MELIPADTPRQVIHAHLSGCVPCAALLTYARRADDRNALARWRRLLAKHLANEREQREYDRDVLSRLAGPGTS